MPQRITIPDEHVAVVLPRDAAHRINSLMCDLRRRARRNSTGRVQVDLTHTTDQVAVDEYILSYADAIVVPSTDGE